MSYDAVAESVALVQSRRVEPVQRLSRRRRFTAMAVDVDGDVAVTMFARRGVACVWQEFHVLAQRQGTWRCLGGGGTSRDGDDDLLADRPAELPVPPVPLDSAVVDADPKVLSVEGCGGVHDDLAGADRWPWSGRWINYAEVRVNAQVVSIRNRDRLLPVPWHGRVAVVWAGRGASPVIAVDEGGKSLGAVLLRSTR